MADRRFRARQPGFMRVVSIAVLSFVLVACGGESEPESGNGDSSDGAAPPAGDAQAIFIEQGCVECHGEQGEGIDGEPESVVAGTNMIEQQFTVRIRNGRGAAMPGYSEEQISADEILLLYEWLRNQ